MTKEAASNLRAEIDHPILDADGHSIEYAPLLLEYLDAVGGAKVVDRYLQQDKARRERQSDVDERRDARTPPFPWWTRPARDTVDRATAMLPGLFAERLEEIGIDHSVVYPSAALGYPGQPDPELRRALCRAVNTMRAETFGPYRDRLTPVAVIPAQTPDEAIDEIEYAVATLGLKAIVLPSHVLRTCKPSDPTSTGPIWVDNLAIDSLYDYDPLWAKCLSVKVVPTFHSNGMWGSRSTPSNYVYNHVGHFAASSEIICKSLLVGGVTRRFPALRFAFLEGGSGWAVNLLSDLVGHWTKRGGSSVNEYDPRLLDLSLLRDLVGKYGTDPFVRLLDELDDEIESEASRGPMGTLSDDPTIQRRRERLNDFDAAGIETLSDFGSRFIEPFFFGCEADDPMTAVAFDPRLNPLGKQLNALLSSDIGHWDVPSIAGVVEEAHELVDHGLLSSEQFRAFAFGNALRLYTDVNPRFFDGTTLEDSARSHVRGRGERDGSSQ